MLDYRILYRGSLSSCNYSCHYCPFAKTANTKKELETDRRQLERFVNWIEIQKATFGVLLTPWGEGLIRSYYQQEMVRMSHFSNVHRIAIQTHLGGKLDSLSDANSNSIAFWATYHPDQTSIEKFLDQCRKLDQFGFRYSVGVVGMKENFDSIKALRYRLRPEVYLWVNAYKRVMNYYSAEEKQFLLSIDPYFENNNVRHPSFGKACDTGDRVFSVNGEGDVRRCHFVDESLGNLYTQPLSQLSEKRPCPNQSCGCHIGYVHLKGLKQKSIYGENLLERIPMIPGNPGYEVYHLAGINGLTRPLNDRR